MGEYHKRSQEGVSNYRGRICYHFISMNGKQESQLKARANLSERMLLAAERANQQLEGTLSTFTLVMAAIALKHGGRYILTEEDINAASGVEFKITKEEEERAIILRAGDATKEGPPQIDQGYVPDKLCPFIMDDGNPLNDPQPADNSVKLTDL